MIEMYSENGSKRALVLGGGGPVGRAWQCGLLSRLAIEGIMVRSADLILGTSAGAIVGAQLALGLDLGIAKSVSAQHNTMSMSLNGFGQLICAMAQAAQSNTPEVQRQEIGRVALLTSTINEQESIDRLNFLAKKKWPTQVKVTAVNAGTGEIVVWHHESGIPLDLGVASSCALPGVWPPITINEERYMDGGIRSMLNADLAVGHAAIIVVSCFTFAQTKGLANPDQQVLNASLTKEIAMLKAQGALVNLITPCSEFLDLTQHGARMLDATLGPEAFRIGDQQGKQEASQIEAIWQKI